MDPELPLRKTSIHKWDWNGTFTEAALGDPYLHKMFRDAIDERWAAAGRKMQFDPEVGNLLGFADPLNGWADYQSQVWALLIYYVHKYSDVRAYHHLKLASWDKDVVYDKDENNKDVPLDFIETWRDAWRKILPKNGLRRRYPLTIHSLDDKADGKSGRALFSYKTDVTKDEESKWSGKYFEGGNGSWTLSKDQDSQPTAIKTTGRCRSGDYIGTWLAEDIRDMLNKLTITYSYGQIATFINKSPNQGPFDPVWTASSFNYDFYDLKQYVGNSGQLPANGSIEKEYPTWIHIFSPDNDQILQNKLGVLGAVADVDASKSLALKDYKVLFQGKGVTSRKPNGQIIVSTNAELGEGGSHDPDVGWVITTKDLCKIKFTNLGLHDKFKKISFHTEYTWNGGPNGDWVDVRQFTKFSSGFPALDSSWNNKGFHNNFGAELDKLHLDYTGTVKGNEFLTDYYQNSSPLSNYPNTPDIQFADTGFSNFGDHATTYLEPNPFGQIMFARQFTFPFIYAFIWYNAVGKSYVTESINLTEFKFLEGLNYHPGSGFGDALQVLRTKDSGVYTDLGGYSDLGWGYQTKTTVALIDWTNAFKYKG